MKFLVGVEIQKSVSTVVVVETEASSRREAERIAIDVVCHKCIRARQEKELGVGEEHEWGGDCFSCMGVNTDEEWDSGEWSSDIKI